ncbi:class I SAM-dependent methyltransferase [Alicyclobacillus fastidiosus]|uniref:Class I SAM-dependent methyltransferase n=1 Tax=Alicyclobacillus fastidiosus TaxID=392011 RepID=A0ABV5AG22_9BACL|nr:class I SAM-dependent methyltransferase [Alicyclobacillus fastidiosus]WEH11791.1 class I SAM-dependent methyltransferase [Alicyclobacillus fastidiosus]
MKYHDMLARLGVANAHPGGGNLSAVWMNAISVPDAGEILDLGCGNGATACALAKRWPCQVTALDIRSKMLENTRRRARREGVTIRTVRGSAEALPFPDHQFDLVVCESVLVFVRLPRALSEISRVLKPSGQVVDVEMMTLRPVTPEWRDGVRQIYGVEQVPDLAGWRTAFKRAGFACEVLRSGPIERLDMSDNQRDDEAVDRYALSDPQVLQLIEANGRWLEANHRTMGYGVFLLSPANSAT